MRLEKLKAFLKEQPNDPFLLFAIAKEYEKGGDQEKALAQYQLLVQEHADYVGTYYHLGKLLERSGKTAEALQIYRKGMQIARAQGDQHALSELAGAALILDDE
jgi:tetratricopeptide (TPR) repeat protein